MADVKEIVELGKTANGKLLQWVRQGKIGRIQFADGGQLPAELEGGWTDQKNALTAVNSYLAKAKAKATPKSRAQAK